LDLDDHHEEAMRGESNWTSGDGGDGERRPRSTASGMLMEHLQWNLDLC
jgi:hypothetical protein